MPERFRPKTRNGYRIVGVTLGFAAGILGTALFGLFLDPGQVTMQARDTHGLATFCIVFPALMGGGCFAGFSLADKRWEHDNPPPDEWEP